MKLRQKGNTIGARLSEPGVNSLTEGEPVVEETYFPSSTLLCKTEPNVLLSVDYSESILIVSPNKEEINNWARTDKVSIPYEISTINDNILSILVVKDLKFLTVGPEVESVLFPNSNMHHC